MIVEYSDYQCPSCSQTEGTVRQVLRDYGNQVRLVYLDFSLRKHARAMDAAIAALIQRALRPAPTPLKSERS